MNKFPSEYPGLTRLTWGIVLLYFIIINLHGGIGSWADETDNMVHAIVDLGHDFPNRMVFSAHVVHNKDVPFNLDDDATSEQKYLYDNEITPG